MQSKLIKISILALSIGLAGGCATQQASAPPESDAMAKANSAYALAQNAHTIASEAAYAADQAQKTAEASLECCNDNSSRLDRMFEKAMMK